VLFLRRLVVGFLLPTTGSCGVGGGQSRE